MKRIIFLSLCLTILYLAACTPQGPTACTEDAKVCPDGTVLVREAPDCEFPDCPDTGKIFCTPEQRDAEVCTLEYRPVCGFFDPLKVQCIKAPCANTYSNPCFACADENVLYWEAGECPSQ